MAKIKPVIEETKGFIAVSPKGKAKWCKWKQPDQFGKYGVDLYVENEEARQEFIAKLEELKEKAKQEVLAKGKKIMLDMPVYKEDDEGNIFFKFTRDAKKRDGTEVKIPIYNVYGKEDKEFDSLIGNGSIIKVKYAANPYYIPATKMLGVSLKLLAIQVIELKEYTEGGGSEGFTNEADDDFTADTKDSVPF